MPATFQLIKFDEQYSFQLVGEKGETLLIGGEYDSQDDAEKGIKDVKVGTLMSQQIAAGKTPNGETFFVIKDSTGQIIAKSSLFADQMDFDATLHTVKDNACVAEISYTN